MTPDDIEKHFNKMVDDRLSQGTINKITGKAPTAEEKKAVAYFANENELAYKNAGLPFNKENYIKSMYEIANLPNFVASYNKEVSNSIIQNQNRAARLAEAIEIRNKSMSIIR